MDWLITNPKMWFKQLPLNLCKCPWIGEWGTLWQLGNILFTDLFKYCRMNRACFCTVMSSSVTAGEKCKVDICGQRSLEIRPVVFSLGQLLLISGYYYWLFGYYCFQMVLKLFYCFSFSAKVSYFELGYKYSIMNVFLFSHDHSYNWMWAGRMGLVLNRLFFSEHTDVQYLVFCCRNPSSSFSGWLNFRMLRCWRICNIILHCRSSSLKVFYLQLDYYLLFHQLMSALPVLISFSSLPGLERWGEKLYNTV